MSFRVISWIVLVQAKDGSTNSHEITRTRERHEPTRLQDRQGAMSNGNQMTIGCRPFHGLMRSLRCASRGLRLGLYAVDRFAALPCVFLCITSPVVPQKSVDVAAIDRARILRAANQYLSEQPITITASSSPRSAGGLHDFFSEADYWWPDPKNPAGPYIQRDGMSNPDNFVAHRRALMRLSVQVPALVAAWKLTKDKRYLHQATLHLVAWFVDAC